MLMLTELPGMVTVFERFFQLEYNERYTCNMHGDARIVQFRIHSGRWMEALKAHLYSVNLDLKVNIFTNSSEKKTCVQLCLLFWTQIQAPSRRYLRIFYFRSRLTLYEWVFSVSVQWPQGIRNWSIKRYHHCIWHWVQHLKHSWLWTTTHSF